MEESMLNELTPDGGKVTAESVLVGIGEKKAVKIVKRKRLAFFSFISTMVASLYFGILGIVWIFKIFENSGSNSSSSSQLNTGILGLATSSFSIIFTLAIILTIILGKALPVKKPYAAKNIRRAGLAVEGALFLILVSGFTSLGFCACMVETMFNVGFSVHHVIFMAASAFILVYGLVMFCYCYAALAKMNTTINYKIIKAADEEEEPDASYFTGGAFANFFIDRLSGFVSLITLGIAYPAMACWKLRWKAKHTFIKGRQLRFDGKALQFLGKFLLWLLLSVITLGLYYIFCMKVGVIKWQTKHTHFADTEITEEDKNGSVFNGHSIQLLGVNMLARFVTLITLSFGSYWAHCYKERWFCKHKKIDGVPLRFDGKGIEYFGKRFVWILLTGLTLGIYGFWLKVKSEQWTVKHTKIDEEKLLSANQV